MRGGQLLPLSIIQDAVELQHQLQMKIRPNAANSSPGVLPWGGKRNEFQAVFLQMHIKYDDMVTSIANLEICFRRCCLQVGETSRNC